MRQSTRLVVNLIATFGRMVGTVFLTLFATRLAIDALGAEDYGVFAALGATVGLTLILHGALTDAVGRQLGIEVGKAERAEGEGDGLDAFRSVFNTAVLLYVGMAAAVFCFIAAVAWPVASGLNIDETRRGAAAWTLVATGLTLSIDVLGAPFRAAAGAHQRLVGVNVLSGLVAVWRLLAAVLVWFGFGSDSLVAYGFLLSGAAGLNCALLIGFVVRTVPGAGVRVSLARRGLVKELLGFGVWQVLSHASWRLRMAGAQLLLIQYFGALASASYGVATQLAIYMGTIAHAVALTVNPAIMRQEGGGRRRTLRRLTMLSGRYSVCGALLIYIPVMFEVETLMALWLPAERFAEVSDVAPDLCRLIATWMLLQMLGSGFAAAALASGRVRGYTVGVLACDLGAVAVAWVGIAYLGWGPWGVPVGAIGGMVGLVSFQALYAGPLVDLPARQWVRVTASRALAMTVVAAAVPFQLRWMEPGVLRLGLTVGSLAVVMPGAAWFLITTREERGHFVRIGRAVLARLGGAERGTVRRVVGESLESGAEDGGRGVG